jgi:hypothetical protein
MDLSTSVALTRHSKTGLEGDMHPSLFYLAPLGNNTGVPAWIGFVVIGAVLLIAVIRFLSRR